jgi:hypothetical protein
MNELVEASLQFPTVVFTIGFGITLVYWLFVLIGALDIDLFGHGGDVGDGGVDVDVAGHDVGGHDAGDASGHDGGGDADGHDSDGDGHGGAGVWRALGLGSVPLTISVSVILLVCWVASLLVMHYALPDAGDWLRGVMLVAVLVAALPLAAVLVRPLRPVFKMREGKSNADYIGHTCTINTGTVDDKFGDAKINDNGTVLIIQVRCDAGKLAHGDTALVVAFDEERQAFLVEPSADMLPANSATAT